MVTLGFTFIGDGAGGKFSILQVAIMNEATYFCTSLRNTQRMERWQSGRMRRS